VFAGLVVLFVVAYSYLVPYTVSNWPATGDEPHYLALAESLSRDGDLDLSNNPPPCGISPHAQIREDGLSRPMHMIGLPLLIAWPYAFAERAGVALAMSMLSALAVGLTFLLAQQLTGNRAVAVLGAVALGVTPPFTVYATMIYPEMPGALLVVLALVILNQATDRTLSFLSLGLAAAALPWLVIRFAPISVVLVGIALVRARTHPARLRLMAAIVLPCVLSACLYLLYSRHMYGSWSPLALYGSPAGQERGFFLIAWAKSTLGWLLDQRNGLLMYAPVYLFSVPGLAWLFRRGPSVGYPMGLVLATALLFGIVMPGFWVQWQPATRYLVVALPLLAVGIGVVAVQSRSVFVHGLLLLAIVASVGISAVIYAQPWLAYNGPFAAAQLYEALPRLGSFRPAAVLPLAESHKTYKDNRYPPELRDRLAVPEDVLYFPGVESVRADGGQVASDVAASQGYTTLFGSGTTETASGSLAARITHEALPGRYVVQLRARLSDVAPDAQADARLDLALLSDRADSPASVLASLVVSSDDLGGEYRSYSLVYENREAQPLAVRLSYNGTRAVCIDAIEVAHEPFFSDGTGLMLAWALVACVIVNLAYRSLDNRAASAGIRRVAPRLLGLVCLGGGALLVIVFGIALWSPSWRLDGESMRRGLGGIRVDREADNWLAVATVQAGLFVHGPYNCMPAGEYTAVFRLRVAGPVSSPGPVAAVEAATDDGATLLVSRPIELEDLSPGEYSDVALGFVLSEPGVLALRLRTTGVGEVHLDYAEITRAEPRGLFGQARPAVGQVCTARGRLLPWSVESPPGYLALSSEVP